MKNKTLLLLLVALSSTAFGQAFQSESNDRNTLYAELGGQSLLYSISYDRLLGIREKRKTSFNVGVSLENGSDRSSFGVPVSYNVLFGKRSHYLETGLGLSVYYHQVDAYDILIKSEGRTHVADQYFTSFVVPKIGYRYQRTDGGIFFRVAFTPPVFVHEHYFPFQSRTTSVRKDSFAWGGVSVGWTFR